MKDDDMVKYYKENSNHYKTGLMRIGCTRKQALNYSEYFNEFRIYYYNFIIKEVNKRENKELRILDMGCGTGDDVFNLDKKLRNVRLYGYELSEETMKICQEKKAKIKPRNDLTFYSDLSNINEKFDLIINFCVLEHVGNPSEFIKNCSKLLKKDGTIVIAVPNHYYWWYWNFISLSIQKLLNRKIKTHSVLYDTVIRGVENAGLCLNYHETYGYRPPQDYFKFIPEDSNDFAKIENDFWEINHSYKKLGLEKILYLHLFILNLNSAWMGNST
jgi:2-polyprenyl-3-methyl-5-hydroxy-6-metoxy-1,4-benzoquinol methylase